jgi:hypothetical protein
MTRATKAPPAPDAAAELLDRLTEGDGLTVLSGDVAEVLDGLAVGAAMRGQRVLLVLPAASFHVNVRGEDRQKTWWPDSATEKDRSRLRTIRDPGFPLNRDVLAFVNKAAADHKADLVLLGALPDLSLADIEAGAPPGTVGAAVEWPRSPSLGVWAAAAMRTKKETLEYGAAAQERVHGDGLARTFRVTQADVSYQSPVQQSTASGEPSNEFATGSRRARLNIETFDGERIEVEVVTLVDDKGVESRSLQPRRESTRPDGIYSWLPGDAGIPEAERSA